MIRVKTFQKKIHNIKSPPVEELADSINEWQGFNPTARILNIETRTVSGGYGPTFITATVWYDGEEENYAFTQVTPKEEVVQKSDLQLETLVAGIKE